MSNFANAQVTLKGNNLLARALQGEALTFTRIVMGEGEYSGAVMEAQVLVDQKQALNITKLTRKDNIVTIGGLLELGKLTEEFYWRELGVYAKGADGVEVLYLYGNAGDKASYITNTGLDEKLIDINIVVGNASNVSAIIDSSLVFLTEEFLEEHDNDEGAHPALKVWVQNLFATGDWAKYTQVGESADAETKGTVFGVLNKIKSLINAISTGITAFRGAYTDARAVNLDNLDVKISSRAPANTALSNSTWTDARAVKLDNIGATGDTGGSAATGTVMAKLNAILTWFTGTWTATRAAKLDQLDAILLKLGTGDYVGKDYRFEIISYTTKPADGSVLKSFSYVKGGIAKVSLPDMNTGFTFSLVIDEITKFSNIDAKTLFTLSGSGSDYAGCDLIIPFNSYFTISMPKTASMMTAKIEYYLNI